MWTRCDAETSLERAFYHHPSRHSAGQPIVAGWAYHWIAQVSFAHDSWTAPRKIRRLKPGDNINYVAVEQIKELLQEYPDAAPLPIFVFDAGYEPGQLANVLSNIFLLTFYLLDGRLKAMKTQINTAQQIIEIALALMIERGYNAFSYADITDRLDIRKASIHYHFPNKSDLGRAVVIYYRTLVEQGLKQIEKSSDDPRRWLAMYIEQVYKQLKEENFFCLCTLFAAELPTLPENVCDEVQDYFRDQATWFTRLLENGREQGLFTFRGDPAIEAQSVVAAMQGAMIAARTYQDPERFRAIALRVSSDLQK